MQLYYYNAPKKNFGDDINVWLWPRLLPNFFNEDPTSWMSVIGTIINESMPHAETKIVFSSGAGYGAPPRGFGGEGWHIICVRGPLTAKVLNLEPKKAATDGAILIATFPEYKPLAENKRENIVFMPHHRALDYGNWEEVCRRADIEFISPREDSHAILEKMKKAKLVLADAMHAAIVADTFRVPWVPILASSSINGFKWHDWMMSLNIKYKPVELPSSTMAEVFTRVPLNAFGGMHVVGKSPDHAYEDYKNKLVLMNTQKGYIYKKTRLGTAKTLRYISKGLEYFYIGKVINERLIDEAAKALKKTIVEKSYLSEDSVFHSRLAQMQEKLQEVRCFQRT